MITGRVSNTLEVVKFPKKDFSPKNNKIFLYQSFQVPSSIIAISEQTNDSIQNLDLKWNVIYWTFSQFETRSNSVFSPLWIHPSKSHLFLINYDYIYDLLLLNWVIKFYNFFLQNRSSAEENFNFFFKVRKKNCSCWRFFNQFFFVSGSFSNEFMF